MIEQALTPEEWRQRMVASGDTYIRIGPDGFVEFDPNVEDVASDFFDAAQAIAIANAALPDNDPRKITREWVEALWNAAYEAPEPNRSELNRMADALESYLAPEVTCRP